MTWFHRAGWVLGVAGLFAAPRVAHAITVECSNAYGACEVSNEPTSIATCSCDGGAGDVAGGTDDWDGFSEAELLEVCNDHLELCGEPLGSTTGGVTGAGSADTGWSTDAGSATDTGSATATGKDDVGTADTGAGAGSGDDVGTLSGGDAGGDAGGSNGDSTDGDGGATTGGAAATDSGGPGSSGDGSESSTGQAEGDGPISAGDADGSSSDAGGATEDPGADDSAAGKACSCSADEPFDRQAGLLLAGLVGAFGWRRRSFVR